MLLGCFMLQAHLLLARMLSLQSRCPLTHMSQACAVQELARERAYTKQLEQQLASLLKQQQPLQPSTNTLALVDALLRVGEGVGEDALGMGACMGLHACFSENRHTSANADHYSY